MADLIAQKISDGPQKLHPFWEGASEYAKAISGFGAQARPTLVENACPIFDRLSPDDQTQVLHRLQKDIDIFRAAQAAGDPLSDSSRLVWRFLRECRFVPCSDIFDKFGDDHVVCIYDLSYRQIFQNLRFFDFVSITLEQLFCSPWYEYSSRPPEVEKALYEEGVQILNGSIRHSIKPAAPEHIIEEKNTEELLRTRLKVEWASPFFFDGRTAGMIVVNHCERIA